MGVWVKTVLSKGRITYTAPPEAAPVLEVRYDPAGVPGKWSVVYSWLNTPDGTDTPATVEPLMWF